MYPSDCNVLFQFMCLERDAKKGKTASAQGESSSQFPTNAATATATTTTIWGSFFATPSTTPTPCITKQIFGAPKAPLYCFQK